MAHYQRRPARRALEAYQKAAVSTLRPNLAPEHTTHSFLATLILRSPPLVRTYTLVKLHLAGTSPTHTHTHRHIFLESLSYPAFVFRPGSKNGARYGMRACLFYEMEMIKWHHRKITLVNNVFKNFNPRCHWTRVSHISWTSHLEIQLSSFSWQRGTWKWNAIDLDHSSKHSGVHANCKLFLKMRPLDCEI